MRPLYETDTDRVLVYTGAAWVILAEPEQSWSPTMTGYTVGDGTWSAQYHRSDGWCDFRASFTLGATSAITGQLLLTLPFAQDTNTQAGQFGCGFCDASGSSFAAFASYTGNATQVYVDAVSASVSYATAVATSATVPFTWTTGDIIYIVGRYQMSTRTS